MTEVTKRAEAEPELLPCPFCGGEADYALGYGAACTNPTCGAGVPCRGDDFSPWNRRAEAAPSAPAEVEGLVELRRAKDEAVGDPSRYPRQGIIDRYQGAVVAAYESGGLVAANALTALQARAEKAEAERDQALSQRDMWMERAMNELGNNLARIDQRKEGV